MKDVYQLNCDMMPACRFWDGRVSRREHRTAVAGASPGYGREAGPDGRGEPKNPLIFIGFGRKIS
jgi:hypothetical protein